MRQIKSELDVIIYDFDLDEVQRILGEIELLCKKPERPENVFGIRERVKQLRPAVQRLY